MRNVLIIGGTSSIAQATARMFAEAGDAIYLVARDTNKLVTVTDDLRTRGAPVVEHASMDVLDRDRHEQVIDAAIDALGGLDVVLIAHGTLPDQNACESSIEVARKEFELNCLSTISLLTYLANYFEKERKGTIAVISSVAGDRGRQSNYLYGSAKGAITIFMQGLRNRLFRSNVRVLTIKPGFVDTPMTSEFPKGLLWADPADVGRKIFNKINSGADVIYAPWFWRPIMGILKFVPEVIFKRLSL